MSTSIVLGIEELRSVAFGSISGTYTGIGTVTDNPGRMIYIQNYTNQPMMFTKNPTLDQFPLVANGSLLLDCCSNKTTSSGFFLAAGERFYVKQLSAAPTSGAVYLTIFYGAI